MFYPVSVKTELTEPPVGVTLHGLAGEVPEVVNISLVTLTVNLQVGNTTFFLEIFFKQLTYEGRGRGATDRQTELEPETARCGSFSHWSGQCCCDVSSPLLGSNIHEVPLASLLRSVQAQIVQLLLGRPRQLHGGHRVLQPAALVLLELTVREDVGGGGGGGGCRGGTCHWRDHLAAFRVELELEIIHRHITLVRQSNFS